MKLFMNEWGKKPKDDVDYENENDVDDDDDDGSDCWWNEQN